MSEHVRTLCFAYVHNDPLNATDPTGMKCVRANMHTSHCSRSQTYANIDRAVSGSTSFMAAASLTTEALGTSSFVLPSWFDGVSSGTNDFLRDTGAFLFSQNMSYLASGEYASHGSIAANDRAWVRHEQTLVQGRLDAYRAANGDDAYNAMISELNGTLNLGGAGKVYASVFGIDQPYLEILDQVRSDLGGSIDIGNYDHRVAIGDALTAAIREDRGGTYCGTQSDVSRGGCQ